MDNRLRELRTARQWTQADLAAALDVSRQTVNALETGKYDPSLPLAFRIARLFAQPLDRIFLDPDQPPVLPGTWEEQTLTATPLNELNLLAQLGEEGWELTGLGPSTLNFRRPSGVPAQRWTYRRLSGALDAAQQTQMAAGGWAYLGSGADHTAHYFKRPLA